jgi:hypothetical protein
MNILIPWIAIFLVCISLAAFGTYLQRREKERKQEAANLRKHFDNYWGSALSTTDPASQKSKGAAANAVQSRQGASGQVH